VAATLAQTLVALAREPDVRPLVRALCACARLQLPAAAAVDPTNTLIVEAAEAWLAGAPLDAVADQADHVRGGVFAGACVAAIHAPEAKRIEVAEFFGRQLPYAVWWMRPAGVQWKAHNRALETVGRDPQAMTEIAAIEAELCALITPE
jgi:hypothetical protein